MIIIYFIIKKMNKAMQIISGACDWELCGTESMSRVFSHCSTSGLE